MSVLLKWLSSCLNSNNSQRGEFRRIVVGKKAPPGAPYPNNRIITSKYTIWNFLPKNLLEQFYRIANFYFLIVTVVSYFVDTSVSAFATLLPLLFVVCVTAIKQGYEDWLRHRSDDRMNREKRSIIREGVHMSIDTSDIEVGDIVLVKRDEDVPCDMVMLSSSEEDGSCYITTVNLDGESNLKLHSSPSETAVVPIDALEVSIVCEHPTMDLYKFHGSMFFEKLPPSGDQCRNSIYGEIVDREPICLTASNLLLRGTRLKNTDFVYGCAVYTGHETKISLNTIPREHKVSSVERKLNAFLVFYIIILLVFSFLWVVWAYLAHTRSKTLKRENVWYLGDQPEFNMTLAVKEFFVFMVLFNYILPISMYVTIELQKFFGSVFFQLDLDMYDPYSDEHAKANTSDINEELGQIKYLFTDKTGTLTENSMVFRKIYVDGNYYREVEGLGLILANDYEAGDAVAMEATREPKTVEIEGNLENALICLALCHTVRVDHFLQAQDEKCQHIYQSASPDEKALVEACARLGVIYLGREDGNMRLSIIRTKPIEHRDPSDATDKNGQISSTSEYYSEYKTFALKHILEFDSNRKMMSVIVEELVLCEEEQGYSNRKKDATNGQCSSSSTPEFVRSGALHDHNEKYPSESQNINLKNKCFLHKQIQKFKSSGRYRVICKGADSTLTKIARGNVREIKTSVNHFAEEGYRTLVIASKDIDEAEFQSYDKMLQEAKGSLSEREEKLAEVYNHIEQQFELLGATAVEDKLQDEVYETIEALRKAGIKVWVLTGDKEETALNVSLLAGHTTKDMINLHLNGRDKSECLESLTHCRKSFDRSCHKKHALIINGDTLSVILTDETTTQSFSSLSQECVAVLCCRLSPTQKASVVRLIKGARNNPTTAAVGDGANDVNMILEAHVGIGIMGKEGRQASRSSDFALAKFKHLRKAILVHGHYFYVRLAILIMYFFFKNVALTGVQVFYTCHSAFSAQTFFSSFYLIFFNTTFTALPIFLYGIFEKHLKDEILLAKPALYRHISNNKMMNAYIFAKWNILGIWHSLIYFYGTYGAISYGSSLFYNGWDIGIFDAGTISMTVCMLSVNLKLAIESYLFNWIIIGGYVVSILGYYLVTILACSFVILNIEETIIIHGSINKLMDSHAVRLLVLLMTTMAILPDVVLRVLRNTFDALYSSPIKMEGERERMEEDDYLQRGNVSLITLRSSCGSINSTLATSGSTPSALKVRSWSDLKPCNSSKPGRPYKGNNLHVAEPKPRDPLPTSDHPPGCSGGHYIDDEGGIIIRVHHAWNDFEEEAKVS